MDLSILSLLAQATLVAKAVLVVLLFMSVFSWALMFRKWMNIRAALKKAADGMDRFNHARDLREAVQSLGGDPDSPLYTVAHEGVTEFNRSKEAGNSEDVVVDNVRRALRAATGWLRPCSGRRASPCRRRPRLSPPRRSRRPAPSP